MVTNLRILRTRKGLTIREVSQKLNIPETELCRIERGLAYVPPKWRGKLADFYGVPISEICDEATGWPILVDMEMPKLVRENISK